MNRDLQAARQALTSLAESAHETASGQDQPANTRFAAHQAKDLYRQALAILEQAQELVAQSPVSNAPAQQEEPL